MKLFLFALAMAGGSAHAAEYRAVQLTDDRTISAQIQEISATSITLGIPPGDLDPMGNQMIAILPLVTVSSVF